MECIVQGCPGEMEERRIVHTFVRDGKPIVVEDLPAWVCPVCGYTVLDLEVLDGLFALDMDDQHLLARIALDPKVMVGKPVIRGTRLTVEYILNLLAHDATAQEILEEYEGLTHEDIRACLLFAKVLGRHGVHAIGS